MSKRQRTRLLGKGALLFSNVIDSGAVHDRYLMAHAPDARMFANTLDRLGFLHPSMLKSAEIRSLRSIEHVHTSTGYLAILEVVGNTCTAEGWAVIPWQRRPADCVILAYEEPGRGPIAFLVAEEIKDKPDVVDFLGDRALLSSGWVSRFDRSAVPPGPHLLTAWAFDAKKGILHPLGTPKLLQ